MGSEGGQKWPPSFYGVNMDYPQAIYYDTPLAIGWGGRLTWTIPLADSGTTADCGSSPIKQEEAEMSYETNTRDYLVGRVQTVKRDLRSTLTDTFNIYKNGLPKNYKELIEAFTNNQYKLDEKRTAVIDAQIADEDSSTCEYYNGPFDGIIFTAFPQPDRKGYETALTSLDAAVKTATDLIMVGEPKDGLAALQALAVWTPTTTN